MTEGKLRIYGDFRSGNCYKIQLLCSEMGVDYDWEEVDIIAGDSLTPQFLAMNANGKIPLLALPEIVAWVYRDSVVASTGDFR